jgi:hypothetical protein
MLSIISLSILVSLTGRDIGMSFSVYTTFSCVEMFSCIKVMMFFI